jgi:hypothetical protein
MGMFYTNAWISMRSFRPFYLAGSTNNAKFHKTQFLLYVHIKELLPMNLKYQTLKNGSPYANGELEVCSVNTNLSSPQLPSK